MALTPVSEIKEGNFYISIKDNKLKIEGHGVNGIIENEVSSLTYNDLKNFSVATSNKAMVENGKLKSTSVKTNISTIENGISFDSDDTNQSIVVDCMMGGYLSSIGHFFKKIVGINYYGMKIFDHNDKKIAYFYSEKSGKVNTITAEKIEMYKGKLIISGKNIAIETGKLSKDFLEDKVGKNNLFHGVLKSFDYFFSKVLSYSLFQNNSIAMELVFMLLLIIIYKLINALLELIKKIVIKFGGINNYDNLDYGSAGYFVNFVKGLKFFNNYCCFSLLSNGATYLGYYSASYTPMIVSGYSIMAFAVLYTLYETRKRNAENQQ